MADRRCLVSVLVFTVGGPKWFCGVGSAQRPSVVASGLCGAASSALMGCAAVFLGSPDGLNPEVSLQSMADSSLRRKQTVGPARFVRRVPWLMSPGPVNASSCMGYASGCNTDDETCMTRALCRCVCWRPTLAEVDRLGHAHELEHPRASVLPRLPASCTPA
jgi:hypothetical protein